MKTTHYLCLAAGLIVGYSAATPLFTEAPGPAAQVFIRFWLALALLGLFGIPILVARKAIPRRVSLARPLLLSLIALSCVTLFMAHYLIIVWFWPDFGDASNGRACFFHVWNPLLPLLRWCSPVVLIPLEMLYHVIFGNPNGIPATLVARWRLYDPYYQWWFFALAALSWLSWLVVLAVTGGAYRLLTRVTAYRLRRRAV